MPDNNSTTHKLFSGLMVGFKSIDWLARKVHKLQDTILFPIIKKYWPRKITPNMVTSLRIVFDVIIAILIIKDYFLYRISIIILFIAASLLDFIDGPIARALKKTTKLGAFLDPLSDKLLICPIVLLIIWQYSHPLVYLIVGFELGAVLFSAIAFLKKFDSKANLAGKWKMCFQVFGLLFIFLNFPHIGLNLLWISVGLAIASSLGHIQPAVNYIFQTN